MDSKLMKAAMHRTACNEELTDAFVSSDEVRTLGRACFKSKAALRAAMALVVAACREVRS